MIVNSQGSTLNSIISRNYGNSFENTIASRLSKAVEAAQQKKQANPGEDVKINVNVSGKKILPDVSGLKTGINNIQKSSQLVNTLSGGLGSVSEQLKAVKEDIVLLQEKLEQKVPQDEIDGIVGRISESLSEIDGANEALFSQVEFTSGVTDPFNIKVGLSGSDTVNINNTLQPASSDSLGLQIDELNIDDGDSIGNFLNNVETAITIVDDRLSTLSNAQGEINKNLEEFSLAGSDININSATSQVTNLIKNSPASSLKSQTSELSSAKAIQLLEEKDDFPPDPQEFFTQSTTTANEFPPEIDPFSNHILHSQDNDFPPSTETYFDTSAGTNKQFPPTLESVGKNQEISDEDKFPPSARVYVEQSENTGILFPPTLDKAIETSSKNQEDFPPSREKFIDGAAGDHSVIPPDAEKIISITRGDTGEFPPTAKAALEKVQDQAGSNLQTNDSSNSLNYKIRQPDLSNLVFAN